jgi:citrate synthase
MDEKNMNEIFSADLAGVVVGETAISNVDGLGGNLSYRGVDIAELVNMPVMQVVALLLFGADEAVSTPPRNSMSECEDELTAFTAEHRQLNADELKILQALPLDLHPMLVLQGMIPLLKIPYHSQPEGSVLADEVVQQGLGIAAKIPSIIAARHRLVMGKSIVPSGDSLSLHENFLLMFHGKVPSREQVSILDAVQILQMEHSFNAGTFAGRVCASTLAPIQSSISASIGTLFGVLHGGADQAALEMAQKIGSPENAAPYVAESLKSKTKIMGMGHREYKVVDPRAKILKPMALALCEQGEGKQLLEVLISVEDACQKAFAKQGKEIWANVEFYKGAVFHSLGIESDFFTSLFAMARVYGYVAHYLEFRNHSRLIRPRAKYIGR